MVNGSFWNQLIKFHVLFQCCTQWIIGNGANISYWYDCWGPTPLRRMKDGGPRPISQHILLQEAFSDGSPVISSFTDTVLVLNDLEDRFKWRWSANGEYSAGSVYKILITAGKIKWGFVEIWKAPAVKQKGHEL